jgi:hypothetical protein
MEDNLKNNSGMSQQPLIRSSSNFKLELEMEDALQRKTTFFGRRPPMEDDLQWKTTSNGR